MSLRPVIGGALELYSLRYSLARYCCSKLMSFNRLTFLLETFMILSFSSDPTVLPS